jgi:branched-chain amino acid aminotransferase
MLKPARQYFIKDGTVMQDWQFDPAWTKSRNLVYEVLRVINGKPLFSEDHIERMLQSASKDNINSEQIADAIEKLINSNTLEDGNILICLVPNNGRSHILCWFINHYYPSREEYEHGVIVRTMKAMRKKPTAKIWDAQLRKQAEYLKASTDVYEVLLVDNKKMITEGSKSNIFFIRGNTVFTAPDNKVLPGITRKKVIGLCNQLSIELTEKEIPISELSLYESAFITGTSPKILPISMIDNLRLNTSNELMRMIMQAYDQLM